MILTPEIVRLIADWAHHAKAVVHPISICLAVSSVADTMHGVCVPVANDDKDVADAAELELVRVSSPVNCQGTSAARIVPTNAAATPNNMSRLTSSGVLARILVLIVFTPLKDLANYHTKSSPSARECPVFGYG